MAALDSPQFKDVRFRVFSDSRGNTQAAAARVHPPGSAGAIGALHEERYEPLGSVHIYAPEHERDRGNQTQRAINAWGPQPMTVESGGQMRWSEGNMDPYRSHVGWLAMSKVPGHARMLQGLLGVAVATHGSLPEADSTLSDEGASISRGAARKYGLPASARNPHMRGDFTYDEESREEEARDNAKRVFRNSPLGVRGVREYSNVEAHEIATETDEKYRLTPRKPKAPPVSPDQMRLI